MLSSATPSNESAVPAAPRSHQNIPVSATSIVARPGFYRMPAAHYHRDPCPSPSLSSHVARTLIDYSPGHAWIEHPVLNKDWEPSDSGPRLDKGTVAHAVLLGGTEELALHDVPDWRGKRADLRDAAISAGKTPVKLADYNEIAAMIASARQQLRAIKDIPACLRFDEVSERANHYELVAAYREQSCWFRARIDILGIEPERVVIADYKTTEASAEASAVARRIGDMGYDIQLAFYRYLVSRLLGQSCPPIDCYVITQELSPPHALSIVQVSQEYLTLGWKDAARAMTVWKQCMRSGGWPLYPPLIGQALPPSFIETRRMAREEQAAFLGSPPVEFFDIPHEREITAEQAAWEMGGIAS